MFRFMRTVVWFALLTALSLAPSLVHTHFVLLKPDSWLTEDGLGGPQKGGPCGPGGADDTGSVPSNGKITTVHAGDTLTVQWQVTIPHTGFYRISVAKDRSELKEPDLKPDSSCNFTTPIKNPPDYPGLVDNIDSGATSQQVKLPSDLTCDKCTLQVIMWMTGHTQPCVYHHCADLQILPAGATGGGGTGAGGSGAAGGGSGTSGAAGTGAGGSGASGVGAAAGRGVPVTGTGGMGGTATTVGSGGTSTGNPSPGTTPAAVGAPIGTGAAGTGIAGNPTPTTKKSGCAVTDGGPQAGSVGLLLLTLLALSRRRRAA